MDYAKTIAKAIVAFLVVIAAGIAAGAIPLEPWVEIVLAATVAAIGVYVVPNTSS
jgi:hypothetical protein